MLATLYYCPRCGKERREDETTLFTVFGPWHRRCTRCGASVTVREISEVRR